MGLCHGSELIHAGDEIPQVRIVRGLVQDIWAEPRFHLISLVSYGKFEHALLQKIQQEVGIGAGLASAVPSFYQTVNRVGKGDTITHDAGRCPCWKSGTENCHVTLDWRGCVGPESVDKVLGGHFVRVQRFAGKFDRQRMLLLDHCARLGGLDD